MERIWPALERTKDIIHRHWARSRPKLESSVDNDLVPIGGVDPVPMGGVDYAELLNPNFNQINVERQTDAKIFTMDSSQPIFSGKPGEDVEMFISLCEF